MPKRRSPDSNSSPPEVDQTVEVAGGEIDVKEESGFYEAYSGFANNRRTWFIAYGIGAPVLLISQDAAWAALRGSEVGAIAAYFFLAGVALQIVAALIYKTAMWYLYVGELKPKFRHALRYKVADFFSENYLIEVAFDVATLALFSLATLGIVRVITNAL